MSELFFKKEKNPALIYNSKVLYAPPEQLHKQTLYFLERLSACFVMAVYCQFVALLIHNLSKVHGIYLC